MKETPADESAGRGPATFSQKADPAKLFRHHLLAAAGLPAGLLAGRLLASRLSASRLLASGLFASGLSASSNCHTWVTPLFVDSSAAVLRTLSKLKTALTSRLRARPFLLSPPIGGHNMRLEGNLPSFFSHSAALEPLLRLTLTTCFIARQEVNPKKTMRWISILRAVGRNFLELETQIRDWNHPLGRRTSAADRANTGARISISV